MQGNHTLKTFSSSSLSTPSRRRRSVARECNLRRHLASPAGSKPSTTPTSTPPGYLPPPSLSFTSSRWRRAAPAPPSSPSLAGGSSPAVIGFATTGRLLLIVLPLWPHCHYRPATCFRLCSFSGGDASPFARSTAHRRAAGSHDHPSKASEPLPSPRS